MFVFVWEDREYLLKSRISCFLHGIFKNCPRQFAQLYSLHVDLGRALHENYVYPVLCTLLLDKIKYIIVCYSGEEMVFFIA